MPKKIGKDVIGGKLEGYARKRVRFVRKEGLTW